MWLIYQCEKCKHTYNLPIYERVRPDEISMEYERFLANDKELAYKYGTDKSLFLRNKAEMDLQGMSYRLEEVESEAIHTFHGENRVWQKGDCIQLENPYHIKVREDKIFTQILGLTRSKVKELEKRGLISFEKSLQGLCCLINTTIILE